MGSGNSPLYSGTNGGSQPYAESYSVVSSEKKKDMADPDIYDPHTGYFHNPTATSLLESRDDRRFIFNGRSVDGNFTYVLDLEGNIIYGKRCNPNNPTKRSPHPTLIGGKDPRVQCAGMILFSKGRIVSVNNHSGHFRPNIKSMKKVDEILSKAYNENPQLFDKKSKWSQANEHK